MKNNNGSLKFIIINTFIALIVFFISPNNYLVYAQPTGNYYRVATSGSDTAGCGSEASPCQTIQYATNKTVSGDVILVAAGTYTYNASADNCNFLVTRAVVCILDKNISIIGGYSTSNWNNPSPGTNLTIVDGGNQVRGVAIIAYNSTASVDMENFTIQNGLAQGTSSGSDFQIGSVGGGMWGQNSSVTLRHMIFKNNRAIGGNTNLDYGGAGTGGGLMIQSTKNNVTSVLEDVAFLGNQAYGGTGNQRGGVAIGGGLFTYEATISGTRLTFQDNIAHAGNSSGNGSAAGLLADALGGGAGFQLRSSVNLQDVTATGNQAIGGNAGSGTGGGGFGGGLEAEQSTLSINLADIRNNQVQGGTGTTGGAAMGGGLMTDATNASLNSLKVIKNTITSGSSSSGGRAGSPSGGGAYFTYFGSQQTYSADVTNSIFADNLVQLGQGNSPGGSGGGLVIQGMKVNIIHSTIANNTLANNLTVGQAITVQSSQGTTGLGGVANIKYSIISNHSHPTTTNTSALTVFTGSTANLTRVMFAENTNNTNLNNKPFPVGIITGYDGNLNVSSINYVSPGQPNEDYHLQPTSPAIDKANGSTTTTDIDGEPRPYGNGYDIGADEYSLPTLVCSPSSIVILTDRVSEKSRSTNINITTGPTTSWNASTSASWLYLGSSGTSHQMSGTTGSQLILRADPARLALGTYDSTISVTGQNVVATTMNVRLIVVNQLYSIFLPRVAH